MSNKIQGLVWGVTFPTQSQKLIALKLADHSNDEGANIWPSKARIAKQVGCSETTVQLTLKVFRECGLLEVLEKGGSGPGSTTKYKLNIYKLEALSSGVLLLQGRGDYLEILDPEKGSESDGIGIRWDRPSPNKGSESDEKGVGITDPETTLRTKNIEPPSGKAKRATRLRDDWYLPKAWGEWVLRKYPWLSRDQVADEALKFANYYQSITGPKSTKLNWEKTWQNWTITAFGNSRRPAAPALPLRESAADAKRREGQELLQKMDRKIAGMKT